MEKHTWLVLFTLTALANVSGTLSAQECRAKKTSLIGGKEYRIFKARMSYHMADKACKEWGRRSGGRRAQLANILTSEIQECLKDMITTSRDYTWLELLAVGRFDRGYYIGGRESYKKGGEWRWGNGDAIPMRKERGFQNWGLFEPNDYYSEDCLIMLYAGVPGLTSYSAGAWLDQDCSTQRRFICERDVPSVKKSAGRTIPRSILKINQQGLGNADWGYSNEGKSRIRTPSRWHEIEAKCGGEQQSPVQINPFLSTCATTKGEAGAKEFLSDVPFVWRIENTGKTITIKPHPERSLYTIFHGSKTKHYVEYMQLKFGYDSFSGSEHVLGNLRHAGELQVYHHPIKGQRYALAFFIQERTFNPNRRWNQLIREIANVQVVGMTSTMTSPPGHIKHLLGDSQRNGGRNNGRYKSESDILAVAARYTGSLTMPPCDQNVTWNVYVHPLSLSRSQFHVLRRIYGNNEGWLRGGIRPLQPNSSPQCVIR